MTCGKTHCWLTDRLMFKQTAKTDQQMIWKVLVPQRKTVRHSGLWHKQIPSSAVAPISRQSGYYLTVICFRVLFQKCVVPQFWNLGHISGSSHHFPWPTSSPVNHSVQQRPRTSCHVVFDQPSPLVTEKCVLPVLYTAVIPLSWSPSETLLKI